MKRLTAVLAACLITGCTSPADRATTYTALPIKELMAHVVDPAAQAFWTGAGYELTPAGERDLSPTTEAGWKHVEDGAAGLIEAGNLLKLPGRPRPPTAKWTAHADALTALGVAGKAAAEAHDEARLLEIGTRVDDACDACHRDFRPAS